MKFSRQKLAVLLALLPGIIHAQQIRHVQLRTADGVLEGVVSADGKVRTFKGIPYAAPPVGTLRWRPPQPVSPWAGVRKAADYGARAMQGRIFSDMVFHDDGPSEDCLYLNLWMPADPGRAGLPVMVWIHDGGFVAGSSSEPRQDAGNLSKKGVMVVSFNYRMGVFGFLAHPELARESGRGASGNYGLLDQVAALEWVRRNIAAFGGDPDNVTIFGESAGSEAVSGLVASPLARGLFRRAIGESGALVSASPPMKSLAEAEEAGVRFAQSAFGTASSPRPRRRASGSRSPRSGRPPSRRCGRSPPRSCSTRRSSCRWSTSSRAWTDTSCRRTAAPSTPPAGRAASPSWPDGTGTREATGPSSATPGRPSKTTSRAPGPGLAPMRRPSSRSTRRRRTPRRGGRRRTSPGTTSSPTTRGDGSRRTSRPAGPRSTATSLTRPFPYPRTRRRARSPRPRTHPTSSMSSARSRRGTSPGGRRTATCRNSWPPTGPTSPRRAIRTALACRRGRHTAAATGTR